MGTEKTVQRRTSGPSTVGTKPRPVVSECPTTTACPATRAARAKSLFGGRFSTAPGAGRSNSITASALVRGTCLRTAVKSAATPSARGLGHDSPVAPAVRSSAAAIRCIGAHSDKASMTSSDALTPASHELAHRVRLALGELTTAKHRSAWRAALPTRGRYGVCRGRHLWRRHSFGAQPYAQGSSARGACGARSGCRGRRQWVLRCGCRVRENVRR
mgnify:CR=1 FL=1